MGAVRIILALIRGIIADRAELAVENLALGRHLAVLSEKKRRPRLRKRGRIFRAWLSRFWSIWRPVLVNVQPETVVHWHQRRFGLFWRWKSRSGNVVRPTIDAAIRRLLRRMPRENPLQGAPRIQSELRLLGYAASKATVDLECILKPAGTPVLSEPRP